MKDRNTQIKIANILRKVGNRKCYEMALSLETGLFLISILHLRNLDLNSSNVIAIANCLKQMKEQNSQELLSISFSNNPLLADAGTIELIKSFPESLTELGLVNCGISDTGGIEILNWMKTSSILKMVCIEQNHFSEKLRLEFKKFSANNPQILVVY